MQDLKLTFEKLINDSPIDEANRHHDKDHISQLVSEELAESSNGVIHTNKSYRTHKIEDAAIQNIKDSLGRWVQQRNDCVLKAKSKKTDNKNSETDIKIKKLVDDREEQKSQARDEFMRDNNYSDLKSDFEQTKFRFESMKGEMGGKPPVKGKKLIYILSIMMIGFIEWFINYSTFNIKYPSGIAFGATVLIALSIALASHFHGALLKQRVSLFAPHRKSTDKNQVLIKQSFFSLLLIISLAIVTYNRYDLLMEQMVGSGGVSLPGDEAVEMSVWPELLPFIMMNVLVWIVGVAISYFTHDSQPDYQESMTEYNKAKSKYHKVDSLLKKEESRIAEEFEVKLKALRNSQLQSVANGKEIDTYLDRLLAKEASILKQAVFAINDMLERHQVMLITSLRQSKMDDVKVGINLLSLGEYQNIDVSIDDNYLRNILSMETI